MKLLYISLGVLAASVVVFLIVIQQPITEIFSGSGPGDAPKVRKAIRAIQTYALDAKATGKKPVYPRTLDELIHENYMSKEELQDLTKNLRIDYFQPTSDNIPQNYIFIVAHASEYTTYGYASGVARWNLNKKTEQDAAANP
jgi:hypothetical protein